MREESFNAEAASRGLAERAITRTTRTITIGGLNLIPFLGGTLATVLQELLPDWKMNRVYEFLKQFAADYEKLKGKVNAEAATTIEHALLIENIAKKVAQTSEQDSEKLRAFRAIMANSWLPTSPSKMERDMFLGWADRLQELHIILVSLFSDERAYAAKNTILPAQFNGIMSHTIAHYLAPLNISGELISAAIFELDAIGICSEAGRRIGTMISRPQSLDGLLTGIGKKFAAFIMLPAELEGEVATGG